MGSSCDTGSLSQNKVKGRIVLCQGWSAADYSVKKSGGAGTIIALDEVSDVASTNLIPTAMVTSRSGMKIARYINTTKFATALISKSTTVNATAPVIASFSSRGPQNVARNILKPDIAAPGLDILAAYSKLVSITNEQMDKRFNYFNIVSGTSMACPHVSGAAAYVKTFHPDWSPAAIKSALMTTARPVRPNNTEDPLSSGSGLLNPVQAVHPGLVYDLTMNDYIRYLCREGYNGSEIALITGNKRREFNCTKFRPAKGTDGLNYPSMHAQLQIYDTIIDVVFYRTVTHVGFGPSVYKATVDAPKELNIKVVPSTLSFTKPHQKQSFTVMVKGRLSQGPVSLPTAFLTWDDTRHAVRSPILVYKATMEDAFD